MRKAREDHDIESATSPTEGHTQPTPSSEVQEHNITSTVTGSDLREDQNQAASTVIVDSRIPADPDLGDPQTLQNWSDGVYDWNPNLMDIGFADIDTLWNYGQHPSTLGLWNWDVEDMS